MLVTIVLPFKCVEVIPTPETMTWAAFSPYAVEHNLIAVSLRQIHERHVVCIDPVVGAPCISLLGAHTSPLITQVLWSPRNSFVLFTAGLVVFRFHILILYSFPIGY